mmetsp:Transcript_41199/g.94768  ORF Transcript_41199/g.94768 Transcript_41199/m.94768 type:complete len:321 (+) Transcript_41199:512-1474(+)
MQAGTGTGLLNFTSSLAMPVNTFTISPASPSAKVVKAIVLKPSAFPSSQAASTAVLFPATTTFMAPLTSLSPCRGVSFKRPADPRTIRSRQLAGNVSKIPCMPRILRQSTYVETSGTVGPEPMSSSGSPTTSDKIIVTTLAGWQCAVSCPPFTLERCLRTAFFSSTGQPQPSNNRVASFISSKEIPSAGATSSEELPPEMQHNTRVFASALSAASSSLLVATTPASSGVGWLASNTENLSLRLWPCACPYLVMTMPVLILSPRISCTASAIPMLALPAPRTRMFVNLLSSICWPCNTRTLSSNLRPVRTAVFGSTAAHAA